VTETITTATDLRGADRPGPDLVAAGRSCHARGWMPATAGNLSLRIDENTMLITASGTDKGALRVAELVPVDIETGRALTRRCEPSAEAAIHRAIYRATGARAVVHAHPLHATALASVHGSRRRVTRVTLAGYELLKVLDPAGRDGPVRIPVLPNDPDVARIAVAAQRCLITATAHAPVLLIEGHGATVWATTLAHALIRMECVESVSALALAVGCSARRRRTSQLGRRKDLMR
jgi:methylthioribose-1-phosphate isomerase